MSKTILPFNFVGLLYPRYQIIQIVSYDMNVWILVLHDSRNENEKMRKYIYLKCSAQILFESFHHE